MFQQLNELILFFLFYVLWDSYSLQTLHFARNFGRIVHWYRVSTPRKIILWLDFVCIWVLKLIWLIVLDLIVRSSTVETSSFIKHCIRIWGICVASNVCSNHEHRSWGNFSRYDFYRWNGIRKSLILGRVAMPLFSDAALRKRVWEM